MTENEAIKALEEVQQYRAICTVEELKMAMKYIRLVKKHGTIGQVIEECAEYEAIGTPEECRASREKQMPKRPIIYGMFYRADCPVCGAQVKVDNWCSHCGQKLDWGDEE